jgi:hypothetical protein
MGALPNLPMIEGAIVRTCIERLGKPAHRARSAPGWLLHLPLAPSSSSANASALAAAFEVLAAA